MKVVKSRVVSGAAGLLLVLAGCAGPSATSGAPVQPEVPKTAGTTPAATGTNPSGSGKTPKPCLSSRNHFAGDADTTLPIVCVDIGGVVDLNTYAVGHGPWTAVSSSDNAVLACALENAHATCRAVAAGHALATATGSAESLRVQVFVADPAR
jgi:hypothetical protein